MGVILTHFDFMGVILCLQNLVTHMTNTDSVLLRFDRFFYVLTTVKLVCWMMHCIVLTSIRNFPFSYLVSTESIVRYHLFIKLILQSHLAFLVFCNKSSVSYNLHTSTVKIHIRKLWNRLNVL